MLSLALLSHDRYGLIHSTTRSTNLPLKINNPICKFLPFNFFVQIISVQSRDCCNNRQSRWRWHTSSNWNGWLSHNAHTNWWFGIILIIILYLPLSNSFKTLNKIISPMHFLQKLSIRIISELKIRKANTLYITKLNLWRFIGWNSKHKILLKCRWAYRISLVVNMLAN